MGLGEVWTLDANPSVRRSSGPEYVVRLENANLFASGHGFTQSLFGGEVFLAVHF